MKTTTALRLIFFISTLLVVGIGIVFFIVFRDAGHLLVVHFDVTQGVTTGGLRDLLTVVSFIFFLHILNIIIFRVIYVRSRFLSYVLPVTNGILALLLLMYSFVILSLN